jgi:hypothetical protein
VETRAMSKVGFQTVAWTGPSPSGTMVTVDRPERVREGRIVGARLPRGTHEGDSMGHRECGSCR